MSLHLSKLSPQSPPGHSPLLLNSSIDMALDELFPLLALSSFASSKTSIQIPKVINAPFLKALKSWNMHLRRLSWLESRFTYM